MSEDSYTVPVRSQPAKKSASVLYAEFNDIDIFVEDSATGYRKIYRELLRRVFVGQKIEQVFPIGSRGLVISQCEKDQNKHLERKRLYIVDGDFFLLHTPDANALNGLYVLPRYCIENFLIDSAALSQVFFESHPEDDLHQIQDKLDFDGWVSSNEPHLFNLFVEYAVANKLFPELQTVGFSITKLSSSNDGVVDHRKITERIKYIRDEVVKKCGIVAYEATKNIVISNSIGERDKMLKYVSGKDYLIPSIFLRGCTYCGKGCENTRFKIRLSMLSDITDLMPMKQKVMG